MPQTKGLQETELREQLGKGGRIQGLLVVARPNHDYVAYFRTSWTRGYRILRVWRDKGDRTFRDLQRLLGLVREFGYGAPVTIYPAGCPELRRFRGVLAEDGGTQERPPQPAGEPPAFIPPTSRGRSRV